MFRFLLPLVSATLLVLCGSLAPAEPAHAAGQEPALQLAVVDIDAIGHRKLSDLKHHPAITLVGRVRRPTPGGDRRAPVPRQGRRRRLPQDHLAGQPRPPALSSHRPSTCGRTMECQPAQRFGRRRGWVSNHPWGVRRRPRLGTSPPGWKVLRKPPRDLAFLSQSGAGSPGGQRLTAPPAALRLLRSRARRCHRRRSLVRRHRKPGVLQSLLPHLRHRQRPRLVGDTVPGAARAFGDDRELRRLRVDRRKCDRHPPGHDAAERLVPGGCPLRLHL